MNASATTVSEGSSRLAVYFDGACPLCRREIGFYRDMTGADDVDWIDVSEASGSQLPDGLTREQAMARFHVRTEDGHLADGGDAFAALWSAIPRTRWIGWLASRSVVRPLVRWGYDVFLKFRPQIQRLFRRLDR